MEHIFELVISSQENHTWQGTLRTEEGAVPFQSELELLLALDRLLPPEGLRVREWKNHKGGVAQV